MKRIFALVMSVIMLFCFPLIISADTATTTIKISSVKQDSTYLVTVRGTITNPVPDQEITAMVVPVIPPADPDDKGIVYIDQMSIDLDASSGEFTVYFYPKEDAEDGLYTFCAGGTNILVPDNSVVFDLSDDPQDTVDTPENFKVSTVADTVVILSWDRVSNASGYTIYCSYYDENNELVTTEKDVDKSLTRHTITGLTPETEYHFTIMAYNGGVESELSEPVSATTLPLSDNTDPVRQIDDSTLWVPAGDNTFKSIIKLKRPTSGSEDEVVYIGVIKE